MSKLPKKLLVSVLAGICTYSGHADTTDKEKKRPNFLFLVIEDASPYLLPQYGNESIDTPHMDELAENGVVFNRAYANAPQCSPARSSLISGSYASTYGNDWHRNNNNVPQHYFFPQYLKEAGYFTVNAGKTDYNITREMQRKFYDTAWCKMSGYKWRTGKPNVSYNDEERDGRPFFAQFNNMTTHMSRLTSVSIHHRKPPEIDPDAVDLPPHVPDNHAIRTDYAEHLESMQDADRWLGKFMEDLKKRDLYENTIVFFFSDHGGSLPRGKAFGYNTGYQVQLIVSAPPRWEHLLPSEPGSETDRLVTFADFGPTLLNIAGVKPPEHMQGKPFMGEDKVERDCAFAFRTNTGNHFDPSRSVYTDKYQYIRFYTPYKTHALRQGFQWGMPAQLAWDSLFLAGTLSAQHRQYYEPKPREMLFNTKEDPYCVNNLADDPKYDEVLRKLRNRVSWHIRASKDIGFFPKDVRNHLIDEGIVPYEWVRQSDYPLETLHSLVEEASRPTLRDVDRFTEMLNHERPAIRFWAASGLTYLFQQRHYSNVPDDLDQLLEDPFNSVKAKAAAALAYSGEIRKGIDALMEQAAEDNEYAWSALEDLGPLVRPWLPEIREMAENSFQARSILINFGELKIRDLYNENRISNFVKGYKAKVNNPIPTDP